MRRRKILTQKNCIILRRKLKKYLLEILEEEENFNTLADLKKDAERVEVYESQKFLYPHHVEQWLRGLPIGTAYETYNIMLMLFSFLGMNGKEEIKRLETYWKEESIDLDNFYWNCLADIIYFDAE